MAQQGSSFPGSEYVRYSAPEIPKKHTVWYLKMLIVFAALLAAGVGYGFYRISDVPSPEVDVPNVGVDAPGKPAPAH